MVELIPRAKRPIPHYPFLDIAFRISIFLLLFSILLYGVISFIVRIREREVSLLEKRIEDIQVQYRETKERIIKTALHIDAAKHIMTSHIRQRASLEIFEKRIHPRAQLVSFEMDATIPKILVGMRIEHLGAFWEQLRILRLEEAFTSVDVPRLSLEGGIVTVEIILIPDKAHSLFLWGQKSL